MKGVPWTREHTIIAFALYCITPQNKINIRNKLIQQCSQIIGHSDYSLAMRMRNYRFIEDANQKGGLANYAKMDKQIYEEFKNDWGALSLFAEELTGLALFDSDAIQGAKPISSLTNKNQVSRERHFFRASVFATYESACCITRMNLPNMLIASHIKPYSKCRSASERTDPTNGLLLNTFYDKAFDFGIITIDTDYKIRVSTQAKEFSHNEFTRQWLIGIEGNQIIRPKRFLPDKEFLEYHNDMIFEKRRIV